MRAIACWGVERLSGSKKGEQRKAGNDRVSAKDKTRKRPKAASTALSRALRSVYDDTLREDVPTDFIDLLGKLG
jgi:hypothetical protein